MKIRFIQSFIIALILLTVVFAFAKIRSHAQMDNVKTFSDINYIIREGSPAKLTNLDIYAPTNAKKSPVMIMIHGGGWQIGDKSNRGVSTNKVPFFSENGFIFVNINYRLSPAIAHPEHIRDVAAAVAWVHNNIEQYGGDKNKIFVMGHSAGAHLAALVATDERRLKEYGKDLSIIKGVILLDGAGYDIPTEMKALGMMGGILDKMYVNAFTNDENIQKDASPDYHVEKGKNIPPFLLLTANRFASQSQSEKLAKALINSGSTAEVVNDATKNHGSMNQDFGLPNEMITEKAKEFLDGILGH
jgi:arylformamidase